MRTSQGLYGRASSTTSTLLVLFLLLIPIGLVAGSSGFREFEAPEDPPCTATSTLTGSFVDLRPLIKKGKDSGWVVKGYDYNTNFTLNICSSLNVPKDVKFDSLPQHHNVSAFYIKDGVHYSLGKSSNRPLFRGRRLVLEYSGGSLCPKSSQKSTSKPHINSDDEDDTEGLRKGAIFSLVCDRDLLTPASINYVGELNDCSYFFEVRTGSACPTVKQQALGPVSIFGVIALIAVVVYFLGGCVYQRTVMHARGWKQFPHWQTWAKVLWWAWDTIMALVYAITSIVTRRTSVDSRRGRRTFTSTQRNRSSERFVTSGNSRRNHWNDIDNENRLIDELDEDWEEDAP